MRDDLRNGNSLNKRPALAAMDEQRNDRADHGVDREPHESGLSCHGEYLHRIISRKSA